MSDTNASTPTSTSAPTYTVPLYQAIAQKLQAAANCDVHFLAGGGNGQSATYWRDMAESHREAADALVREHMPSGAGIDAGVTLNPDSDERRLIFDLSYHYMDGSGGYCGWVDYTATVEPSLTSAFYLGLIEDEEALKAIQAEYETVDSDETYGEFDDGAYAPDSAADYIHDVLSSALAAQVEPYARATRELAAASAGNRSTSPTPNA